MACFFQIRRAFHHIDTCFIGESPAAVGLRAEVWCSIFTHDMERYQRVLYNRMDDVVTLITGPSGSGKELVARAIGLSRFIPFDPEKLKFAEDFLQTFIPVNLSALAPTIIESELFGHRKGAFTGALQDRKGYLESCGRYGTVFLDEMGETNPEIQVKLLRVIQNRVFQPLGETHSQPFKGKLMAATHRDLSYEMKQGRFREDLYYRLCADRIKTPSLTDLLSGSAEELECLVQHISTRLIGVDEAGTLTKEVCAWISKHLPKTYTWPGNFRELEQCVRNILIRKTYHPEFQETKSATPMNALLKAFELGQITAQQLLSQYVQHVWKQTGSYEETGKRLCLDRRTVKKYLNAIAS
jgi:DNA-binding NtrC family response regulator